MTIVTSSLKDIGNYIKLRETIDPNHRVTHHVRSSLGVVDLIPVDYVLKFSNLGTGRWAIEYDFDKPVEVFKSMQSNYGLPGSYGGLRLWLTDETQAQESIQHTFDNNVIEEKINTLSGHARAVRNIVKSFGNSGAVKELFTYLENKVNGAAELAGKGTASLSGTTGIPADQDQIQQVVAQGLKTAGQIILQGKQVSLPRIWKGSTYNPTLTVAIKLVSPYGDPEAIKKYIIEPLLYILILTSPRSNDGVSYGLFQPVKVKAYGISNINLGAVTNITLVRGGRETSYNIHKQPLTMEVRLDIDPLSDGFAVMHPAETASGGAENKLDDIAKFGDAATPYTDVGNNAPAITTLGNVIQSLRPAPADVVNQDVSHYQSQSRNATEFEQFVSEQLQSADQAVASAFTYFKSETEPGTGAQSTEA